VQVKRRPFCGPNSPVILKMQLVRKDADRGIGSSEQKTAIYFLKAKKYATTVGRTDQKIIFTCISDYLRTL
jgi:hypothetical protein